MVKKIILTLFCLLLSRLLPAYVDDNHRILTMLNGLPDNTVTCLHKDSDGFLWIGTHNGICRYDGVKPVSFSDPKLYLKVGQIAESPNGMLWVLVNNELMFFDRYQERFLPMNPSNKERPSSMYSFALINDSLAYVLADGKLWQWRLSFDDAHQWQSECVLVPTEGQAHGYLSAVARISDDTIVVASKEAELLFFQMGSTLELTKKVKWTVPMNEWINDLKYIEGNVWICTNERGALCYNVERGAFSQYNYHSRGAAQLSNQNAMGITQFENQAVMVATFNGYTELRPSDSDPDEFEAIIYDHHYSQEHREMETRLLCTYFDAQNRVLWLGTRGGGLIQTQIGQRFYKQYHQQSHNEITAMEVDEMGFLWASSFRNGVMRSREPFQENKELDMRPVPGPAQQPINTYRCIVKDSAGYLWAGGANGFLVCYNPQTEAYQFWQIATKDTYNVKPEIWSLFFDSTGRLWAGTSAGLFYFDREEKTFFHEIKDCYITSIQEDGEECLWIGTAGGLLKTSSLHLWQPRSGFTLFSDFETDEMADSGWVRSLYCSSDGHLYVGYDEGLSVVSLTTHKVVAYYTTRNGLCNNYIGCMTEDSQGRLWIGSNSGISCFNKSSSLFSHYYISGNNRSILIVEDDLLSGNHKSITYFNALKVDSDSQASHKACITYFEVNHIPVAPQQRLNSQTILDKGIAYTSSVVLNQKNYRFSVSFSNLTYSAQRQHFSYRLYPLETNWNQVEEGQLVSYAHLPQGDYTLQVCAQLPLGGLGEPTDLEITVLAPWYKTFWFFCLVLLFVSLFLYLLQVRIRKANERKIQEKLMRQEIETLKREREKERQLHQEKVRFFAEVSHELKTPLTLISAPLQEMEKGAFSEEQMKEKLKIMHKNTQQLSSVVDQMLLLQKMDTGMALLHLTRVDLVLLVQRVASEFDSLVQIKEMDVRYVWDQPELTIEADEKHLAGAIRNLISNAFKYTPSKGMITIRVYTEIQMETPYACVSVSDNGPGINKKEQQTLFDSYATTSAKPTISTKLGIGLRVVKRTMELHHGNVTIESEEGKGACFVLHIPLGNKHLTEERQGNTRLTENTAENAEVQEPTQTKKNLLIIEDNEDMQYYLKSLFSRYYNVFQAFDGEQGVQLTQKLKPHAVLCDMMMPIKDGVACCKEIKANPELSHIPFIVLSARSEEEDIVLFSKMGADDYMVKPFSPEVLLAKVDALILMREQLKRLYTRSILMPKSDEENETSEFMQKVLNVIESHLSDNQFDVGSLAAALHVSNQTLYKKIRQESGLSIVALVRSVRMNKAATLLLSKKYAVQEVALLVGYSDLPTFRKHFTSQFGTTPSRFS